MVLAGSSAQFTHQEDALSHPEDRRIVKTKKALRKALIDLMETKGYEAITVNDLCSAADINRGTFYNHFSDKDALLIFFEDEVMEHTIALSSQMKTLSVKDVMAYCVAKRPLPFLVSLFDYLQEQSDFLHAVLGPGGDIRFGPRMRDTVFTALIRGVLHEKYRNDSDPFVGYYISFYASAYMGVISRWLDTGMKEDSEQMACIAMRLLFIKPGEPIRL